CHCRQVSCSCAGGTDRRVIGVVLSMGGSSCHRPPAGHPACRCACKPIPYDLSTGRPDARGAADIPRGRWKWYGGRNGVWTKRLDEVNTNLSHLHLMSSPAQTAGIRAWLTKVPARLSTRWTCPALDPPWAVCRSSSCLSWVPASA